MYVREGMMCVLGKGDAREGGKMEDGRGELRVGEARESEDKRGEGEVAGSSELSLVLPMEFYLQISR